MSGTKLNGAKLSSFPRSVPSGRAAHVVARPRPRPAPSTGWEAQLDQDVEERAEAVVLDALRALGEWSPMGDVRARLPEELQWRTEELLARLVDAGRVITARIPSPYRPVTYWRLP